jgi:hypothetical protein
MKIYSITKVAEIKTKKKHQVSSRQSTTFFPQREI